MKRILILGAGRSSSLLITYLLKNSKENNWFVTVADVHLNFAQSIVGDNQNAKSIVFDVFDSNKREKEISNADIVISMLPANMHLLVAEDCICFKKNLVTASYVSSKIMDLDTKAKKAGVLILNEIGLDPGIDHMSAMKIIDEIKRMSGEVISFRSYCGGLVHPECDNNPWNYKFTWNPRNVVLAGKGTSRYIDKGQYKSIPYLELFANVERIKIPDAGEFEAYANRDSLSYRGSYGLEDIPTMFRGTLRKKGFCKSWDMFVQLGMTNDSVVIKNSESLTYKEFTNLFLPFKDLEKVEDNFCNYFGIDKLSDDFLKVKWLGIFTQNKVCVKNATAARILQEITEKKWTLEKTDKDMIVMQHQFEYMLNGNHKRLNSSLIVYGKNHKETAMAKTVGLPVAIATKLILNGGIKSTGVKIPVTKDIYDPVLNELAENGINFIEEKL